MGQTTYGRRFLSVEEKIATRLGLPDEQGCRMWLGRRNLNGRTSAVGYGTLKIDGKWKRVTRLLWELQQCPIPEDGIICHTCDNPPCCEISHLFLGDQRANVADRVAKGRGAFGCGALDETGARRVLQLRREAWTLNAIAADGGISAQAVWAVVHGKSWKRLQPEGARA